MSNKKTPLSNQETKARKSYRPLRMEELVLHPDFDCVDTSAYRKKESVRKFVPVPPNEMFKNLVTSPFKKPSAKRKLILSAKKDNTRVSFSTRRTSTATSRLSKQPLPVDGKTNKTNSLLPRSSTYKPIASRKTTIVNHKMPLIHETMSEMKSSHQNDCDQLNDIGEKVDFLVKEVGNLNMNMIKIMEILNRKNEETVSNACNISQKTNNHDISDPKIKPLPIKMKLSNRLSDIELCSAESLLDSESPIFSPNSETVQLPNMSWIINADDESNKVSTNKNDSRLPLTPKKQSLSKTINNKLTTPELGDISVKSYNKLREISSFLCTPKQPTGHFIEPTPGTKPSMQKIFSRKIQQQCLVLHRTSDSDNNESQ